MIHYIAEMFRANYHCDKHPVTNRVFADPAVAGVVDLDTAVVAGIVDPDAVDLAVADLGAAGLGVAGLGVAGLGAADPDAAGPGVADPDAVDPDAVDLVVVDLGVVDQVVVDQVVVDQVVVDLDVADPGAAGLGVVDQVVAALDVVDFFGPVLRGVFCPVAADPVDFAMMDHLALRPLLKMYSIHIVKSLLPMNKRWLFLLIFSYYLPPLYT